MVKISLLLLAALLLPTECSCADDLLAVVGEGAFLGLTIVSSLTCTGFNVVHLAQRNPSEGWGAAGVLSGAVLALLSVAVASDDEIDDQICWQCTGALAAVTFLVGIGNLTGAHGQQQPSAEQAVSLVAGMRPDGPKSLQPTLGLVWRF